MADNLFKNPYAFVRIKMKQKAQKTPVIRTLQQKNNQSYIILVSDEEAPDRNGWKCLPLSEKYQFQCGGDKIPINIMALVGYPSYEHHLNLFPNNSPSHHPKYQLALDFMQWRKNSSGYKLAVQFVSALLKRDTELIGKMKPYIVVQNISNGFKWTSKAVKGDKTPQFNQKTEIPLDSPNDNIKIKLWDDDMFKDDEIAEVHIKAYQLLSCFEGLKTDYSLQYKQKGQIKDGGTIKLIILNKPEVISCPS